MKPLPAMMAIGIALVGGSGCGSERSSSIPVSGNVTFDGAPVPEGYIVLKSVDGATASNAGKIVAGKYELSAAPGAKQVEIDASRPGPIDPETGTPNPVQYIPPQYNRRSKLRVEVISGGENRFDFELHKDKQ